jgi:hypothetical protein
MIRVMATHVYNLNTLDGVHAYLTDTILADIRKAFGMRGALAPFGVVFATLVGAEVLTNPRPLVVGHPGLNAMGVKRAIQQLANASRAVGCVYARQDSFKPIEVGGELALEQPMIVVQLEHQAFPDRVWHAKVTRRELTPFVGPELLSTAKLQLKQTAFLPQRWMA